MVLFVPTCRPATNISPFRVTHVSETKKRFVSIRIRQRRHVLSFGMPWTNDMKMQRRKAQNRQAQRNHRMRSEAKLEQLRARVQSQAHEITALKQVNRMLQKDLDRHRLSPGASNS